MDPSISVENPVNTAQTKDGVSGALTAEEQNELAKCEQAIGLAEKNSAIVAMALLSVRDGHLYRVHYLTFEIYCRQRWKRGATYAYDLIRFATILREFSAIADIKILPEYEGQTRPLARVDNGSDRTAIWRRAVAIGKRVTGKRVTQAREEFWIDNPERVPTRLRRAQNSPHLDTSPTHKTISVKITVRMETLQMLQQRAAGAGATLDRVVSVILEKQSTKPAAKASSLRISCAKDAGETRPTTGFLFPTMS